MKLDNNLRAAVMVCATAFGGSAMLIACGGGGGADAPVVINGTISGGAAWPQGTRVVVTDSTKGAPPVCETKTTAQDGVYSCPIPVTAKPPLVVTATQEDKEPMVSVVPAVTAGTVNVNPATHAVAALLINGDPNDAQMGIAALVQITPTLASPELVAAQQTAILNTYKALAPDAMATAANPFSGKLTTDGKGMDAVLDNVKIVVTPTGQRTATMAVTTTATRDDSTQAPAPLVLNLAGNASLPAPAPSSVVTPEKAAAIKLTEANAVKPGTTEQINDLLARITACHAEPQSTRISPSDAATAASAAAATVIVSPTCKSLFVDNDSTKFLNDGYGVSGSGYFSGIFTINSGLGAQFSQGNYQYTVKTDNTTDATKPLRGDVVFTAKWEAPFDSTDAATGATTRLSDSGVEVYTARPAANGKLYLIGNLSNLDVAIKPRAEFRDFTHSAFSKYSYISSGYVVYVNSKYKFGKVVVTTPSGSKLTLKQISSGSYSYMGLSKPTESESPTTTSETAVVYLASAYMDPSTTSSSTYCGESSNHPRDINGSLFWTCTDATHNKNWTDEELAAIPDQGTWTFDLYTKWDDPAPVGTTYRRTLRRAPTLAEITATLPSWPSLTPEMRTQITAASAGTGAVALSYNAVGKYNLATAAGGAAWQVPTNAKWMPKSIKLFGADGLNDYAGFQEGVNVYSSWRKATIGCNSSGSDQHCDGKNVRNGNFRLFDKTANKGADFKHLSFEGMDARGVQNVLTVHTRKE